MFKSYLAVADAVDHLVVVTVEGVCQEAQALQHNNIKSVSAFINLVATH